MKFFFLILASLFVLQGAGVARAASSSAMAVTLAKDYLQCATPDRSVVLAMSAYADEVKLSVKKTWTEYIDGERNRVIQLSTGETVVRDVETGRTLLTMKAMPLLKSDRGFEKKVLISQSDRVPGEQLLQCRYTEKKTYVGMM